MNVPKHLKTFVLLKDYQNVVDALHWARMLRKMTGSYVVEVEITPDNRTRLRLSKIGLLFYIFWSSLYAYCAYMAQIEDQTILRNLYQTKLKRYGDDFERLSSFLYVVMTMYLLPFHLSGNNGIVQKLNDLDILVKNCGGQLNYVRIARKSLLIAVIQVCVYLFRMACLWVPINKAKNAIAVEKIFQVVYSDTQAIIVTAIYCFFMIIVGGRFQWINKVLTEIKDRNNWKYKVYSSGKPTLNILKVAQIQEKHVREKMKTCAHAYSLLFKICSNINSVFGLSLLLTLFHYLNFIILYLFYVMEATAAGLFTDVRAYIDFLVYAFWEIAISILIIFLIVYVCENVMEKAKDTASIVHEIINGDLSADMNIEAMQFSIQLLHEKPVFTLLGLFHLDYALLQQGARSVSTYLVILLQFVTQNDKTT